MTSSLATKADTVALDRVRTDLSAQINKKADQTALDGLSRGVTTDITALRATTTRLDTSVTRLNQDIVTLRPPPGPRPT
jgi:hypothetical protein